MLGLGLSGGFCAFSAAAPLESPWNPRVAFNCQAELELQARLAFGVLRVVGSSGAHAESGRRRRRQSLGEKGGEAHTSLISLLRKVQGGGGRWGGGEVGEGAKSKTPQKREQRSSGPGSSALPSEGQGPVPNKASPCQKAIPLQAEPQTRRSYSVLELSQVVDMRICVMSFQSRLGVECCSGEALNSHAHNSALLGSDGIKVAAPARVWSS